jgi:hypothetical protein
MRSTRRLFNYLFSDVLSQLWQELCGTRFVEKKKVPIKGRSACLSKELPFHLVGLGGALVIISLNLRGSWIGKELTGPINQDGIKMLILQITAKLHELCMLASMGFIVCSPILGMVTSGTPLPLGALVATQNFKELSFLWSSEFLSLCSTKFRHKAIVLPIIIAITMLGVLIGPSSATGLIPVNTDWPAARIRFTLNATFDELWPNTLTLTQDDSLFSQSDAASDIWTLLTTNLFNFWGKGGLGYLQGMVETVQIPGEASIRTLNVRFRGPETFYNPSLTAATVQSVAIADNLAALYYIWAFENAGPCTWARTRLYGSECTYQDMKSVITAQQPVAYVRCNLNTNFANVSFPDLDRSAETSSVTTSDISFTGSSLGRPGSYMQWVDLASQNIKGASIGALVLPGAGLVSTTPQPLYACTVDAQWANASAQSSFLQGPYQITGWPDFFFDPTATGSDYQGQHIAMTPEWAALVNPSIDSNGTNTTAFDKLFTAGSLDKPDYVVPKIEAVLAVLVVERLSQIRSNATVLTDVNLAGRILRGNATLSAEMSPGLYRFDFVTLVTGYGYGLFRATGLSMATLFSVMMLLAYCVITVSHFVVRFAFSGVYVDAWNNTTELFCLALQSPPSQDMCNSGVGVDRIGTLRTPIRIAAQGGHVQIVTGWDDHSKDPTYQRLKKNEPYGSN